MFTSHVIDDPVFLRCDTASLGSWLLMFERNHLPSNTVSPESKMIVIVP